MSDWHDYKCPRCGKTGLSWQDCDYAGCPDGREPPRRGLRPTLPVTKPIDAPHIDFVATYRVPAGTDWLSIMRLVWIVLAMVCSVLLGWWMGARFH